MNVPMYYLDEKSTRMGQAIETLREQQNSRLIRQATESLIEIENMAVAIVREARAWQLTLQKETIEVASVTNGSVGAPWPATWPRHPSDDAAMAAARETPGSPHVSTEHDVEQVFEVSVIDGRL